MLAMASCTWRGDVRTSSSAGGENIYPVEIENRLIEHPGLAEVAVVGVAHPTLGQEVTAYVVEKVPGTLTEADVRDWCAVALAGFKVPAHVEFVPICPTMRPARFSSISSARTEPPAISYRSEPRWTLMRALKRRPFGPRPCLAERGQPALKDPAKRCRCRGRESDREAEREHVRQSKAWQRTLFDGGWAGITWPKEYGGRGGTPIEAIIFAQEQARFDVPTSVFAQGIGMAGPTIMAHGTDGQKERFLEPMLRGEEVWCQLFSEPGAGSDLAALATSAVRDGDEFLVNGQKVWTSSAHFSDWGILLARTDFDAPKHRGITYFLVDMTTPGIDVRPLRQATGAAHFNEVFLTDVRIPADNVVGAVNGGWGVIMTTLTNERTMIGTGAGVGDAFGDIVRLAREFGRTGDPVVRQALADTYIRLQLLKYLGWRIQTAVSRNQAARARELGAQAGPVPAPRPDRRSGHVAPGPSGDPVGLRRQCQQPVGAAVPGAVDEQDRWGDRADPAQHHRRAGARAAR